jgi:hypothetical protein
MVSLARVTPKPVWLLVLCVITLGLSLAAPVLVEAAGGAPDSSASRRTSEDHFTVFHAEAFDLMDDSALLSIVDLIYSQPVVCASTISLPAEWTWSPALPVRPPISSNSI